MNIKVKSSDLYIVVVRELWNYITFDRKIKNIIQ